MNLEFHLNLITLSSHKYTQKPLHGGGNNVKNYTLPPQALPETYRSIESVSSTS